MSVISDNLNVLSNFTSSFISMSCISDAPIRYFSKRFEKHLLNFSYHMLLPVNGRAN